MGKKKKNAQNVASLIPSLVQDMGWEKQLDLHSIFPQWKNIVSSDACEHAVPLKIERGVLWLEVENSSWLQQLQYEKLELLDNLNGYLRLSSIKDIKMILPRGKGRSDSIARSKDGTVSNISFCKVDPEKIADFQAQIEFIEDEKSREALMQFWYLAQACKRDEED